MVLRRPYAFLIKNFKLIHLLLVAVLTYIAFRYRQIYIFLGECISDSVNRYDAGMYINYSIIFFIFIALGLLFVVYWLLKFKDKPRYIYMVSLIGYCIFGVYILVVFGYLSTFNTEIINQKTIRLYRDILLMCNLFQYFIIIFMLIRGLGFDVKKFNFAQDAQELNLSAEDAEEVEINTKVNFTGLFRRVRKQQREFGYFFKEFKIYIIVILVIVVVAFGYMGYNYFSSKLKVYSQDEYVGEIKYLNVLDSYYDVVGNKYYIVIKFSAYKNGTRDKLNTSNIILNYRKKSFVPNKNVCYKYNYLGSCYKQQYLNNNPQEYILVYEASEINLKKLYITYSESYEKRFKIKINPTKLESD